MKTKIKDSKLDFAVLWNKNPNPVLKNPKDINNLPVPISSTGDTNNPPIHMKIMNNNMSSFFTIFPFALSPRLRLSRVL